MAETKRMTIREALSTALREEMHRDERVFIMGQEVGVWGGTYAVTRGFHDEFGEKRVRDTPISEMAIVGAGVGAAMAGLRPVSELMTINFAFLALDAIVNHAAKIHYMFGGQFTVPLVIRTTTGGGRQLGATHSHSPEPLFAHFPGLYVACPATPDDAYGLLKTAIRNENPVMFIEHSTLYQKRGDVPTDDPDYMLPVGKSRLVRQGDDVTLVTFSKGVHLCVEAADRLAEEGIEAEIIDLRWLRPLDTELFITSFKKTNRMVVVEEGYPAFGLGAEISARVMEEAFDWMDAPIKRVTSEDVPLPYSHDIE
ncbi:MAG: alpha-ketoacid dehydrogenase subunit beta, partial [Chloroflexi bacterium]|nr:alpha-ketoacid dehydrogenase subunit beta [Chloroflexota bacterium]